MSGPTYSEAKYNILVGIYAGIWGMLPILTVKLVPLDLSLLGLGVISFSFSAFTHAITFPCTDAAAEVWGGQRARRMVYIGFSMFAVSSLLAYIAAILPGLPTNEEQTKAFETLFKASPRIVVASLTATVVAQLFDVFAFERIKKITGEKGLWVRNNVSTMLSQLLDTTTFYTLAFYNSEFIPNEAIPTLILGTYLVKITIAIIDTPSVYLVVYWITGQWSARGDLDELRHSTPETRQDS